MKRIILLCLLCLYAIASEAQVLTSEIEFSGGNMTVIQALSEIEQKASVHFSYPSKLIRVDRRIRLSRGKQTVQTILKQVFQGVSVGFSEKGKNIILYRKKREDTKSSGGTGEVIRVRGQVLDAGNSISLPFTNIRLGDTYQGFTTNEVGVFDIRIPQKYQGDSLHFSFVGYTTQTFAISALSKREAVIRLKIASVDLEELVVKPKDPAQIVADAIASIPANYPKTTTLYDLYYRELVKVDTSFVKFADAVAQMKLTGFPTSQHKRKPTFSSLEAGVKSFPEHHSHYNYEGDELVVHHARASNNLQKIQNELGSVFGGVSAVLDFEQFDIHGSAYTLTASDEVRNPLRFLHPEKTSYYTFELVDITTYQGRNVYEISFQPKKKKISKSAFEGVLYIDTESNAIVSYDYQVPESHRERMEKAGWMMFIGSIPKKYQEGFEGKKLFRRKMTDYNHKVHVEYQQVAGKWYLSSIRKESYYLNSGNVSADIYSESISELFVTDFEVDTKVEFEKGDLFRGYLYHYPSEYEPAFWAGYNTIVPTGVFGKALNDLESEKALDRQFKERVTKNPNLNPPVPAKKKHLTKIHGKEWSDDYHWLRNVEDDEVQEHIRKENKYFDNHFIPLRKLKHRLYYEMIDRINKNEKSTPIKIGDYYYYSRYEEGKDYEFVCRKKGSLEASEEIVFDLNQMAEGNDFYTVEEIIPSPNHQVMAYTENLSGGFDNIMRFKKVVSGELLPDSLPQVGSVTWSLDGNAIFYVRQEAKTHREYQVYKHVLGTHTTEDQLVYEEKDERFSISLYKSRSRQFIFLSINSKEESEVFLLDTNGRLKMIAAREDGHDYHVNHVGNNFYILSNDKAINNQLFVSSEAVPTRETWRVLVAENTAYYLSSFEVFDEFLVLKEQKDAQSRIRVLNLGTQKSHIIKFKEEVYAVNIGSNPAFESKKVRLYYTSPVTPTIVYDYDMEDRKLKIVKQEKVVGGFVSKDYVVERVYAMASDGVRIPITLIYKKGATKPSVVKANGKKSFGKRKMYLTAYGSYGISLDPYFSYSRLSLLDRNVIIAIAHVRGGGENGKAWHDAGRLLNKKTTFSDFITCAEHLIAENYIEKGQIVGSGGSAGGLLMGAVANSRPDLFKALILNVPFVDVVNTMLDDTLPLTTGEYKEWGDPARQEYFDYIRSYSPYDNVKAQDYPHMLFMTAINDSNVPFWEGVKMVAKLRELKTDENEVLISIRSTGGHLGGSHRFDGFLATALEYAFVLDVFSYKRKTN